MNCSYPVLEAFDFVSHQMLTGYAQGKRPVDHRYELCMSQLYFCPGKAALSVFYATALSQSWRCVKRQAQPVDNQNNQLLAKDLEDTL